MATRINVMVTPNQVYASYVETICFIENYNNELEREIAIAKAKKVAFDYGLTFGSVQLNYYEFRTLQDNNDIFKFLAKNGKA